VWKKPVGEDSLSINVHFDARKFQNFLRYDLLSGMLQCKILQHQPCPFVLWFLVCLVYIYQSIGGELNLFVVDVVVIGVWIGSLMFNMVVLSYCCFEFNLVELIMVFLNLLSELLMIRDVCCQWKEWIH
jgi:hypothetical protein